MLNVIDIDTLKSHCLDFSVIQRISVDQKMFDCCLKMRFTLLGILILHQAKSQSPKFTQSSWNLLPNVVVVNVDGSLVQHPLTCLGSFNREEEGWRRDNDWVWRRDGEEDEEILWMMGEEEKKKGNSFLVNLEERTGGGIFTCHSLDRTLLKNTTVLVKHLDEQKRILEGSTRTGYMKCSTRNYQGEFHCSWNFTDKRVGTVMSVRVARGLSDAENVSCAVDASGQQWTCSSSSGQSDIMCSVNRSGLGVACVDRQYCPYAEETDRITLTVYMRTNYLLEEYSQRFYLSDIVKPDKVSIKEVNSSTIEWSYPVSWNSPISYFPLSFQVKEIKGRERKNGCMWDSPRTKVHTTESSQWSVNAKVMVCVRAQDALCDSPWSDWTEYRHNKGNKRAKQEKKKKKQKCVSE